MGGEETGGDGADARHHDGDTAATQLMGPARDSHRPDSSLGSACITYTSNITDITDDFLGLNLFLFLAFSHASGCKFSGLKKK